ncbi:MAG: PKD domain-containing protein [Thermoplasmatota archaeon]
MGSRGLLAMFLTWSMLIAPILPAPVSTGASSVRILWTFAAPGKLLSAPALGDLEGDGEMEAVVADSASGLAAVSASGTLKWTLEPPLSPTTPPLLADMEGDGTLEVLVGAEDGCLRAFSHEARLLWCFTAGSTPLAPPAAADLDSDGLSEVVLGTDEGLVHAVGANGRALWSFRADGSIAAPPLVLDLFMDGHLEVVVATSSGAVYALSAAGQRIWSAALSTSGVSALAACDLGLDGTPELVAAGLDGSVQALGSRGELIWSHSAGAPVTSVAVSDLDIDGRVDVVFGTSNGWLRCLGPTGFLRWELFAGGEVGPISLFSSTGGRRVAFPSGDGSIHVVSGTGDQLWSAPVPALRGTSCVVSDMTGAGEALLLLSGGDGRLYCLRGGEPALLDWPQLQHDPRRTGNLLSSGRGHLPGTLRWSVGVGAPLTSSPELADLTGDGLMEAAVTSSGGRVELVSGPTGAALWSRPFSPGSTVFPSPLVADVNADGEEEVVVSAPDGVVRALRGRDGATAWEFSAGGLCSSPSAANLDEDAPLELVVGTSGGSLFLLSGQDGGQEWRAEPGSGVLSPTTICDLDGDARLDVAVATQSGPLALSGEGGELWSRPAPGVAATPFAAGDMDGDGLPDLLFGSEDGRLTALRGVDGAELWSRDLEAPFRTSPTLVDLPGGSPWDVVAVAEGGELFGISGETGDILWRLGAGAISSAVAADIDRDGLLELFVGTASGVLALSPAGGPLWRFNVPGGVPAPPSIADIDADGCLDVVAGSLDGGLYCLFAGGSCDPRASPWPSLRHDARRTGNPYSILGGFLPDVTIEAGGLLLTELLPVEGDPTTVHVTVRNRGAGSAGPFSVALEADGARLGEASLAGGLRPASGASLDFVWVPGGGIHTLRAVADPAGALEEASESNNAAEREVRVNFRPLARAGPDVTTALGAVVIFDGSSSLDPDGVVVDFNWSFGDGGSSRGPTAAHRYRTVGSFTVVLTVRDDGGATGTDSLTVRVSGAPELLRWEPEGDVTIPEDGERTFSVEASDPDGDVLAIVWSLDGTRVGEGPSFTYVPDYTSAGEHALVAEVTDGTSRVTRGWRVVVTEAGGPLLSWRPADRRVSANTGDELLFSVTLRSSGLPTRWLVDGAPVSGASGSELRLRAEAISAGSHVIRAEVRERGRLDARDWELTVYLFNRPPEFSLLDPTGGTAVVTAGGSRVFTALVTDPDSSGVRLQWFLNGALMLNQTSSEFLYVNRLERGPQNLTVVASDGERAVRHSWSLRVNLPPRALLNASRVAPGTGERVLFSASGSSDEDGGLVAYSWRFGDGGSCSTAAGSAAHTYARPGVYLVELTVTDDLGASSTSRLTIFVRSRGEGLEIPGTGGAGIILALLAALAAPALLRRRAEGRHPQR